ncbi:hypothetical protein MCOR02_009648 [Pyricularia oryzae]|uniref:Uncharacterized protein n=3 Tax=Pyricularia oryzae TaxID=318829 RepID=G4N539_PYRO7|nr:uncharacterized protein MGG_16883 [Pyricularia oryzae 70-15]ELQ39071.1 hypothetical protein OOU_Y34scaffold00516g106 [Pyricularia oryzae Y34]KAH9429922.1 hypothetical protein MCOR02_009648 [Pyricularia oryzae]EHA52950.1 hypothetical protein MGG_16883 [Pyricularia oryzae 70-15]KAI6313963.1 hypothetical protein MCOR30_010067 [Pyricularia oryzae]KAI6333613.1 hypothetical protein MCOR28_010436 [Pyricularia oryzae]
MLQLGFYSNLPPMYFVGLTPKDGGHIFSIVNPVDSVLDCGERDRRLGEDGAEALYVLAQPTSFVTLLLQTAG